MAGHSKWANIRHKKARADQKKGKIFSRIAKEIISAVKTGGADPKNNPRLRLALQNAKDENVPNDVIERNIKKASSSDSANYEELMYEIYGFGGVGLLVLGMTDNRNRFASEMRIATNKRGGTIANPGSVSFNFEKKGIITLDKEQLSEEELFEIALELSVHDFESEEDSYWMSVEPQDLYAVKEGLLEKGVSVSSATFEMIPKTTIQVSKEIAEQNNLLIEWLEDLDDVDSVYHNQEES